MNRMYKKKTVTEKEICDFLSIIEEKFENDVTKIDNFSKIMTMFNNSELNFNKFRLNEEQVLEKIKEIFSETPVLTFEINKLLPKTFRLVKYC